MDDDLAADVADGALGDVPSTNPAEPKAHIAIDLGLDQSDNVLESSTHRVRSQLAQQAG